MLRTALLSATLAVAAYASALWLTHDFQVWTAEGARRLDVALAPIATPGANVEGPGLPARALSQLLADGRSVTLVDFVYTRCQTVCLTLGTVYQQMQAQLQAHSLADRSSHPVQLLSISLDGQHDRAPVLQAYAARLGADAQLWRFIRVPDAQEFRRLLTAFQVVVVPDGRGGLEHNAALLVVDQHGRLVRVFDYADQQLALNYAHDLAGRRTP
jgi:protein SCO1/2